MNSNNNPKLTPDLESQRLITYKELEAILGCSRKTIWLDVKEGRFPAPSIYGRNRVAWTKDVVLNYLNSRPKVSYTPSVLSTDGTVVENNSSRVE